MPKKLFISIGILLIIYGFAVLLFVGFGQVFSYIWLVGGVFLIIFGQMHKSVLKTILAVFMTIVLCICTAVEIPIIKGALSVSKPNADYIIVLGAKVNGTSPSRILRHRLDASIEYITANKNTKIIVTGGKGNDEDIAEACVMKAYLVDNNISPDRIIIEDKATDTNENLKYSKEIINNDSKSTVIATSDFHMYRALKIAKHIGFTNVSGKPAYTDIFLSPNYYLREAFAVIKNFIL